MACSDCHHGGHMQSSLVHTQPMRTRSHAAHLPVELLAEVARHLPSRFGGRVVNSCHISAFSQASRLFREVSLPQLYREVTVTSRSQLCALSENSTENLSRIKHLSVFMDDNFVDAWRNYSQDTHSVYPALARILSRSVALETFRIRVAQPFGSQSAWKKFSVTSKGVIDLARGLGPALEATGALSSSSLRFLRVIELDGFMNTSPLLSLSPNLDTLALCMSAGFPARANKHLLDALPYVPKLRRLHYTPTSLLLPCQNESYSQAKPHTTLLDGVGVFLPELEVLDLQTRYHGQVAYFTLHHDPISEADFLKGVDTLPNLRVLRLGTTVASEEEFDALRTRLPVFAPQDALANIPVLREALEIRGELLNRIVDTEKFLAERAGSACARLGELSFVRTISSADPLERAVSYRIGQTDEARGARESFATSSRSPTSSSSRTDGIPSTAVGPLLVDPAKDEGHCRPLLPPSTSSASSSLPRTLESLWAAPPGSQQLQDWASAWKSAPVFPVDFLQASSYGKSSKTVVHHNVSLHGQCAVTV